MSLLLVEEFELQVRNLIDKGYPEAAGISLEHFLTYVAPLKEKIGDVPKSELDMEKGYIPFVIVIKSELVSAEKAMSRVQLNSKSGFIGMYPVEPESFKPIDTVKIPESSIYLLLDIDRGKDTINIAPEKALKIIYLRGGSPLTIDEGIGVITHYPDFLKKNNCFSLPGSRRDDRRVPALWLSKGRPRLGWCWAGNPHTWLGSASCRERIGL